MVSADEHYDEGKGLYNEKEYESALICFEACIDLLKGMERSAGGHRPWVKAAATRGGGKRRKSDHDNGALAMESQAWKSEYRNLDNYVMLTRVHLAKSGKLESRRHSSGEADASVPNAPAGDSATTIDATGLERLRRSVSIPLSPRDEEHASPRYSERDRSDSGALSSVRERQSSGVRRRSNDLLWGEPPYGKSFDVFLSYRVGADLDLVKELYYRLRAKNVEVWWDRQELEVGATFKGAFARGIADSAIFVPIVSWDALAPLRAYPDAASALGDSMLLEYAYAFHLHDRCREECAAAMEWEEALSEKRGASEASATPEEAAPAAAAADAGIVVPNEDEAWYRDFFKNAPTTATQHADSSSSIQEPVPGSSGQHAQPFPSSFTIDALAAAGHADDSGGAGAAPPEQRRTTSSSDASMAEDAEEAMVTPSSWPHAYTVSELIEDRLFSFQGVALKGPRSQAVDSAVRRIFLAAKARRDAAMDAASMDGTGVELDGVVLHD